MKRLLLLLLLLGNIVHAQEMKRNRLEFGYAIGDAKFTTNKNLIGAGGQSTTDYFRAGFMYVSTIDSNWAVEIGLDYSKLKFILYGAPGITFGPENHEVQVVSMPIKARYSIGKYLYLNGGLIVDIDIKNSGGVNKLSGMGLNLGAGGKFDLKNGLGIFVNPQINSRQMIPFTTEKNLQRVFDSTVNFGLAYSFR